MPVRGEIWIVDLDPTCGAEINKTRPCLVLSSDSLKNEPIKIVAPITGYREDRAKLIWHVKVPKTLSNGLDKDSSVDVLQVRGVANERFMRRLGRVSASVLEETTQALALVIEYKP